MTTPKDLNRLELRLRENTWSDDTVGMNVDLLVDGAPVVDFEYFAVDVPGGLLPTIGYNGAFFPIVCTCGDAGCAGIFEPTIVSHESSRIHWHMPKPAPPRDFVFDAQQYAGEISRLIDEAKRLIAEGKLPASAIPDYNQSLFEGKIVGDFEYWRDRQLERHAWTPKDIAYDPTLVRRDRPPRAPLWVHLLRGPIYAVGAVVLVVLIVILWVSQSVRRVTKRLPTRRQSD